MPPVNATYSGIACVAQGVLYQRTLGPTPNVTTVILQGHHDTVAAGDLVLTDGATTITISNLEPISWRKTDGPDGQRTEVQVRDSRWRWQSRGHVTGEYNRPGADGAENPEKSIRALVALCLDALGETGYTVSALPNDLYPYVLWEYTKPGDEINRLCDMCACAVSLDAAGHAVVYKLGVGATAPAGHKKRNDLGAQLTLAPDIYTVRGGRRIIQRTSELVPVGLDVDGVVKELDDLSYYSAAASHWGSFNAAITARFADWYYSADDDLRAAAESARKSILFWYRLQATELVYCPILDHICETITENGKTIWKKPYVMSAGAGTHDKQEHEFRAYSSAVITDGFEIDAQRGLVKFRHWLAAKSGALYIPASVDLVWASESRQSDGSLDDEDYYSYSEGEGDSEEVILIEWLALRGVIGIGELDPEWQNLEELDAIATKIIAAVAETNASYESAEIEYANLISIVPDGVTRDVQWAVSAAGATTRIIRNTERPPLGGQRLELRIAALKRRYESAQGKAAAERMAVAGSTAPRTAASPAADNSSDSDVVAPETRAVYNAGASDCPADGLLLIGDGLHPTRYILQGARPESNEPGKLVIACHIIPAGTAGECYINGPHECLISDYANINVNDPCGFQENSHYARKTYLGPLKVLAKVLDNEDGTGIVRVDWIPVECDWESTGTPAGGEVTVRARLVGGSLDGPTETVAV